jgi:hypothetical protein
LMNRYLRAADNANSIRMQERLRRGGAAKCERLELNPITPSDRGPPGKPS